MRMTDDKNDIKLNKRLLWISFKTPRSRYLNAFFVPAYISNHGHKYYYRSNLKHRENGPASTFPDGRKIYYIGDKRIQ